MSRIEELFQDIAEEFAQGNRQERELSRANVDTSDLYKNDPLLLEGLITAGTFPIVGASAAKFAISNTQLPKWLAPFTSKFGGNEMGLLKTREPFLPETSRKIKDYAERQKLADQKMMFQQKQIRNRVKNYLPLGTTTKNPMEGVAAKRILEQQTNRRNFLRQNVQKDQSLISANEAPSPEYFKNMSELKKLEDLLK